VSWNRVWKQFVHELFQERMLAVPSLQRGTMLIFRGNHRADAAGATGGRKITRERGKRLPAEAPAAIPCSLLPRVRRNTASCARKILRRLPGPTPARNPSKIQLSPYRAKPSLLDTTINRFFTYVNHVDFDRNISRQRPLPFWQLNCRNS
jgi:hypothetical protein